MNESGENRGLDIVWDAAQDEYVQEVAGKLVRLEVRGSDAEKLKEDMKHYIDGEYGSIGPINRSRFNLALFAAVQIGNREATSDNG